MNAHRYPVQRIAIFTPLPPTKSGIADHVEEKLPEYARHFEELHIFVGDDGARFPRSTEHYQVHHWGRFQPMHKARPFDAVLYHLGNNFHSNHMWKLMVNFPGIVVPHDLVLNHVREGWLALRGEFGAYMDEGLFNHGEAGLARAREAVTGMRTLRSLVRHSFLRVPVESARAVMVHSYYGAEKVHEFNPDVPVLVTGHPFTDPFPELAGIPKEVLRRELGLPQDAAPILGSFGFVIPFKRIEVMLRAIKALRPRYPNIHGVVVGQLNPQYPVEETAKDLGIADIVTFTGRTSLKEFHQYLRAVDFGFNLRYPSAGETSASLTRMLGFGIPTFISHYNQFKEYPKDACLFVDLDREDEQVEGGLVRLMEEPEFRKSVERKARRFASLQGNMEDIVAKEAAFIKDYGQRPKLPLRALVNHLVHFRLPEEDVPGLMLGLEEEMFLGKEFEHHQGAKQAWREATETVGYRMVDS